MEANEVCLLAFESKGEIRGTPTEALAISIDTFYDFNNSVQVVKYSSYEKNSCWISVDVIIFANKPSIGGKKESLENNDSQCFEQRFFGGG